MEDRKIHKPFKYSASKVRKILKKRRRTGESTKDTARRLSQEDSGGFIGGVAAQWLKNKRPVRIKKPSNHVSKVEAVTPPPKPTKGGKRK